MKSNLQLKHWDDVLEFFRFTREADDEKDGELIMRLTSEMIQLTTALEEDEDMLGFLRAMVKYGTMSSVSSSLVDEDEESATLDPERLEHTIMLNLTTFATIFFEFGSAWGRSGKGEIEVHDVFERFLDDVEKKNISD